MEKHWFQIMTEYTNGDTYMYEAQEFERIRKTEDGEYILLIKGVIDTMELYEDLDANDPNFEFKYNYDTIAEIELRENETGKKISMLDGDTGRVYILDYTLIDSYFSKCESEVEILNINIIDILGDKFVAEKIS